MSSEAGAVREGLKRQWFVLRDIQVTEIYERSTRVAWKSQNNQRIQPLTFDFDRSRHPERLAIM